MSDGHEVNLEDDENEVEAPTPVLTKKDPKRVEQGKKLAMISKQAKEKKMREKIQKENFSYVGSYVLPVVAVLSTTGLLYMLFFGRRKQKALETIVEEDESPKPKKSKNFETLD